MAERGLVARGLACGAVGPVDLAVAPGGCLAVLGVSGAGKSLVLRMLADLIAHDGEVWLDGVAQTAMPASAWRRRVTYVAAESAWWAATVAQHFPEGDPMPLMTALRLAPDLLAAPPDRLSTGERQRFGLIRALLGRPDILLLDEPTSALDPAAVAAVEIVLAQWRDAGGGLIVTSHDSAQIDRMAADRITLPGRGRR